MKNLLGIYLGIVTQFPPGQTPIDGPPLAYLNGALTSPHQGQHIGLPKRFKTLLDNKYYIAAPCYSVFFYQLRRRRSIPMS
ncbi:MAG: hypothetical protein JW384_02523 [Nitrosomonadaceae bacterium]|nr:hypothetical protein [Nitrosomonadaceae bacterium]